MKKTYIEKLKDPRWQKKRLEILSRDDFTCQKCFNSTETLHVHHRYYEKGSEPWEYTEQQLVTLCATCHEEEGMEWKNLEESLIMAFKRQFFATNAIDIASEIFYMQQQHTSDVVTSALAWVIGNTEAQEKLIQDYFEYLKKRKEE